MIRLRALIVGAGDLIIGVMLGWMPRWHSSASLHNLSHLGLPWWIIGLVFIAAAALVAFPASRAAGYGLTSVLVFVAAWSLALVSSESPTANAVAVVGLFMLAALLLCGVATAQQDRGRRDAQ